MPEVENRFGPEVEVGVPGVLADIRDLVTNGEAGGGWLEAALEVSFPRMFAREEERPGVAGLETGALLRAITGLGTGGGGASAFLGVTFNLTGLLF